VIVRVQAILRYLNLTETKTDERSGTLATWLMSGALLVVLLGVITATPVGSFLEARQGDTAIFLLALGGISLLSAALLLRGGGDRRRG
jgi:hypothetical protein